MGFEPNAVAQTVGESSAVAGGFDDVAGDLVDFVAADAGGHGVGGGLFRALDDRVDFPHFWRGLAKADHSRHVGGVALMDDTEVDEEQVTRLDDGSVGEMVDFPAVWADGDNGGEGVTVDVFVGGNFGEDESLHSPLGHARADLREDGIEDLLVDFL